MKNMFGRLRKRTKSNMFGWSKPSTGCITDFTMIALVVLKIHAMTTKTMPMIMSVAGLFIDS